MQRRVQPSLGQCSLHLDRTPHVSSSLKIARDAPRLLGFAIYVWTIPAQVVQIYIAISASAASGRVERLQRAESGPRRPAVGRELRGHTDGSLARAERCRLRVRDELPEGRIRRHVLRVRAVALPLDRPGSRRRGRRFWPHAPRVAVAGAAERFDCRVRATPPGYWSVSAMRTAASRPNDVSIR